MSDDATVVWLVEGNAREDAAHALTEWARARGVHLVAADERGVVAAVDPTTERVAERIETELGRARDAISATDADTAERSLARIENTLRAHPELPQAAWLRAEVERTWAARWIRVEPRDEGRARDAWENAAALDGGRVAGIGETDFPPRPRVKTTIIVAGRHADRVALDLDGVRLSPTATDERGASYVVEVAPAEHQLIATTGGRLSFAGWIAIAGSDPSPIRVTVADGGACAHDRFDGVSRADDRVMNANGVTCPSWIAAVPGDRTNSVLVARCEADSCGPLLEWRVERLSAAGPPQGASRMAGWPAWATWTLLGIGAATATSVALIATGVFETRAVEPRFVVGGGRQE